MMENNFLTVRLNESDASLLAELNRRTGASKSEIVKQALRKFADETRGENGDGLFTLGAEKFGKYGDANCQSADVKAIVRAKLNAKRPR